MEPITAVIPFRDGHETLPALLDSLPADMPVVIVDDQSSEPLQLNSIKNRNTRILRADRRLYFAGAVNAAMRFIQTDALVLNQDVMLAGPGWLAYLDDFQTKGYAIAGHAQMKHPHWPAGYVQGQFMFLSKKAWVAVGDFNERDFPLWGCTAEWQCRAARKGFPVKPLAEIPGMVHARPKNVAFGSSIQAALEADPAKRELFIRTPPLVTVIVTSYNYGRYLWDCVASLVGGDTCLGLHPGQTFQAFEIVLVDDASTDKTWEVMQSLADPFQAIRAIHRETKGGTPAANNTGIKAANGKFITILCGDDMREPDGLENLYRVVERNPKAVPYDDMLIISDGQRGRPWPMSNYSFERLLVRNMMHAGVMFAKEGWSKAGGYPEVMDDGREDWAFNIALGKVGYCGHHVEKAGYLYRREGQNRSLTNQGPEWRDHFMTRIQRLFPGLYAGERPMGCCGGGGANPAYESNGSGAAAPQMQMGAMGMTRLEYLGGNDGTESYYSRDGTREYVFSKSRNFAYVDNRDVQLLLDIMQGRKATFRIAEAEAPAPALSQPVETPTMEVLEPVSEEAVETGMAVADAPAEKPARKKK